MFLLAQRPEKLHVNVMDANDKQLKFAVVAKYIVKSTK